MGGHAARAGTKASAEVCALRSGALSMDAAARRREQAAAAGVRVGGLLLSLALAWALVLLATCGKRLRCTWRVEKYYCRRILGNIYGQKKKLAPQNLQPRIPPHFKTEVGSS